MARGTVNKTIILGRLGQDPEMRTTASGTSVVNLSLATNELGRKDPNSGQRGEVQTEWHRIILFGQMADNANTYLKKGSQVYIEGRLQTRKWQDQQGIDRYSTEIVGNEMQFIGGKPEGQGGQQGAPAQPGSQGGFGGQPSQPHTQGGFGGNRPATQPQGGRAATNNFDDYTDFDDSIPF